jgi:hypothetical protein
MSSVINYASEQNTNAPFWMIPLCAQFFAKALRDDQHQHDIVPLNREADAPESVKNYDQRSRSAISQME